MERGALDPNLVSGGKYLRRRQILLPTWRLGLILAAVIGTPAIFGFLNAYHWLAINSPVPGAPNMIVEGWLPDPILKLAAEHSEAHGAETIFCTGIPLEMGSLELPYKTYADYSASALTKLGIPARQLHAVPSHAVRTERTREMARALRDYLENNPSAAPDKRANLLTLSTHGRRSRQIFQQELGEEWEIGVVSFPDPEANPDRWFLSSNSAKGVVSEIIALSLGLVGGN